MDIEARKIEFIKEFLQIQSEETIAKLENFLKKEKASSYSAKPSISKEELNQRVSESEADFENGRFKKSGDILNKFE